MQKLPKPRNWDEVMMEMALVISQMSKDPSTKVGAVLVSPDRTRISVGYNGFPVQVPDVEEWWNNRDPEKGDFCKYDLVRHAEINAITQAKTNLKGWTIFVTHHPCLNCANSIVAEGISRVVYHQGTDKIHMSIDDSKVSRLFDVAGVKCEQILTEIS